MHWTWVYPALMLIAVTVGAALGRRSQRPLRLTSTQRFGLALGAFCGAMIGAKLPFVLADWEGLVSGRAWFDNGKTILFGLVGGYLGVEFAKWALDVRVKTGDSFAVPVAVSVAIGRLACFSAGCCFGRPTGFPWGVDFGDGVPRHPAQLYEALFHSAAALGLYELKRRGLFHLQRIKLYILAYLAFRFVTEFLRPEPVVLLGLTSYQWAALGLAPVFLFLWARDRPAGIALDRARAEDA